MNDTVVKPTTSLDSLVGVRIRDVRKARGINQTEFGRQMCELVGAGWSRQVVWQVENGQKPCSIADLIAAARVLGCTVADLTSSSEPLTLGGVLAVRTDTLVSGASAAPEIEGWARFIEAGEALNDVRNAWARYTHSLDVVRNRIANSDPLRQRIIERMNAARAQLRDEIAETHEFRPPPGFDLDMYTRTNATPAMQVAADSLSDYPLPNELWRRRETTRGSRKP